MQENISAVRVVKAYVREEYETTKFQKACNKVYEMFVRAEKLVVMNMPVMQFTSLCMYSWNQLAWCEHDRWRQSDYR